VAICGIKVQLRKNEQTYTRCFETQSKKEMFSLLPKKSLCVSSCFRGDFMHKSSLRTYSSAVEHLTADQEVTGSIPVGSFVRFFSSFCPLQSILMMGFIPLVFLLFLSYSSSSYVSKHSTPILTCQDAPLNTFPFCNSSLSPIDRATDLVSRMVLQEKYDQLLTAAPSIPRLGVQAVIGLKDFMGLLRLE
jgi:hypothetical protein